MTATNQRPVGSAHDETPLYVRAGNESVFGILTRPVAEPNGLGVLFLHAGAQNLSSHRNALWTQLARELAGIGYLSFRMDYHGTGDSSGLLVDRNVDGQTTLDVESVIDWLANQEIDRLVVVGTCWGGIVGLTAAARREIVHSVCMVTSPIRLVELGGDPKKGRESEETVTGVISQFLSPRVIRLLLSERDYRAWALQRAKARLRKVAAAARGMAGRDHPGAAGGGESPGAALLGVLRSRVVGIHMLFGEQERSYRELLTPEALPLLQANIDMFDVRVTPVRLHGLSTLRAQAVAHDQIIEWLEDIHASVLVHASQEATGT